MSSPSFVFLGGGELPWVYPLGAALADHGPTTIIRLGATRSLRRTPVTWPFEEVPARLERLAWDYPPGFAGRFAPLFTPLLQVRTRALLARMEQLAGRAPFVVISDPRFGRFVPSVPAEGLAYLNFDDLASYDESARGREHPAESECIRRAGTTLCASRFQTDRFKAMYAARAADIFHLPHGVHPGFLNPCPAAAAANGTVCVVGALTARYDWDLIISVVTALADVEFAFVGEIGKGNVGVPDDGWESAMQVVLSQPNVEHVRGLQYRHTAQFYWKSTLSWLPYRTDLAFVRSSCPLKLTDGLASGHPVVSAGVPESRLYPEWVHVHADATEAAAMIRDLIAGALSTAAAARRCAQVDFARQHSWSDRARQLATILCRRDMPEGA